MAPAPNDRLFQDSDEVARTRTLVGSHGEDVRALHHTTTHTTLTASLSGIVGRSGEALTALGERWQTAGTRHSDDIDLLGRSIGTAGTRLENTDQQESERIRRVPRDL